MTDTLFTLTDDRQQRLLAGEAVVVGVRRSKGRFLDPLAASPCPDTPSLFSVRAMLARAQIEHRSQGTRTDLLAYDVSKLADPCDTRVTSSRRGKAGTRNGRPESDWANPYSTELKHGATRDDVIRRFEQNFFARTDLPARPGELRGRALGCRRRPERRRGDVPAALANRA